MHRSGVSRVCFATWQRRPTAPAAEIGRAGDDTPEIDRSMEGVGHPTPED